MKNNYIDKEQFVFELVVCKGKGKVSNELSHMFYLIANNLKNKNVFNITDFHDDQVQEAYCMMMESWYNVEPLKYPSNLVFAYFTERAKRSYVKIFNTYMDRDQYKTDGIAPIKHSLTNIHSL